LAHIATAIVAIVLILVGALTLTSASLSSAGNVATSLEKKIERAGDYARTELTLIQADTAGSGTDVDSRIQNTGQTALKDFSKWDVVVKYYATTANIDMKIERLAYTTSSTPNDGEWTLAGIYLDTAATITEAHEPNILNPGETMLLRLNIDPEIPGTTDNLVAVGVTNGVQLEIPFAR
jgi:archaellum component FlaF (FlaF/FlaG flagellin family)